MSLKTTTFQQATYLLEIFGPLDPVLNHFGPVDVRPNLGQLWLGAGQHSLGVGDVELVHGEVGLHWWVHPAKQFGDDQIRLYSPQTLTRTRSRNLKQT